MSRVGKEPISVPGAAKISLKGDVFEVQGPKGKMTQKVLDGVEVKLEDGTLTVSRTAESISARAIHGLMRSLLANAVHGVTEGFQKQLEIVGVGYRAEVQNRQINFALGYSHPIHFPIPAGIDVEIDKQNRITVVGCDRQQVGQVAAEIRSLRKPDPYKGKGIRYTDEVIRRKVGKAGGK